LISEKTDNDFARLNTAMQAMNRQSRQAYTPSQALKKVRNWSAKKRNAAVINRKVLGKKFPGIKQ
jgi:hypothetical protein